MRVVQVKEHGKFILKPRPLDGSQPNLAGHGLAALVFLDDVFRLNAQGGDDVRGALEDSVNKGAVGGGDFLPGRVAITRLASGRGGLHHIQRAPDALPGVGQRIKDDDFRARALCRLDRGGVGGGAEIVRQLADLKAALIGIQGRRTALRVHHKNLIHRSQASRHFQCSP